MEKLLRGRLNLSSAWLAFRLILGQALSLPTIIVAFRPPPSVALGIEPNFGFVLTTLGNSELGFGNRILID
jgi:hypothetical protein